MHNFNIYSRREFLGRSFKTSMAVALATLTDIPFVMKRALAEGSIDGMIDNQQWLEEHVDEAIAKIVATLPRRS